MKLQLLALVCAAVPALLYRANLKLFRKPSRLLPARNEAGSIEGALASLLAVQM